VRHGAPDNAPVTAPFEIRADDLTGPEIEALLREHLAFAAVNSPPGSRHALPLERLRAPNISFWTVWRGGELAGCGALKELDPAHGEVKSMRTAAPFLRQGVGSLVLAHLIAVARRRRYRRLSLETGSQDVFVPARALYARFGFAVCGPFASYVEDPNSVYMTLALAAE
jgi:putative acetyltransferase